MSIRDIAKKAVGGVTKYVAELEADHARVTWLEQNPSELLKVYESATHDHVNVRDAIDRLRKGSDPAVTTDEKFDQDAS